MCVGATRSGSLLPLFSVRAVGRERANFTPLETSVDKGSRIRPVVSSQSKVQARKRPESLVVAGLELVGNDVRPERVPMCGS